MAIETEPGTIQQSGGGHPAGPGGERPWWSRPGIHTALIGAAAGYAFGHWLGNYFAVPTPTSTATYQQVGFADANDFAIVLGFAFMVIGWLAGLGVFNDLAGSMTAKREKQRGGRLKFSVSA